jgi:hypothetical protein
MTSRTDRLRRMAAVGMLSRTYTHEFNNVLGGILGSAQLLALRSQDPELRDRLATIVSSVQRGMALTASLAQVARNGRSATETTLDVHAVLTELLAEGVLPVGTEVAANAAKATVGADGEALREALVVLAGALAGEQPLRIATGNSATASERNVEGLDGSAAWLRIDIAGHAEPTADQRRLLEDPLSASGRDGEILLAGAAAVIRQSRGRIAFGDGAASKRISVYLPTL